MSRRRRRLAGMWTGRVDSWHEHVMTTPAFARIRDAVITRAAITGDDDVVDLGAGTGFLSLAVADRARSVLAVDVAPAMLEELQASAERDNHANVSVQVADLCRLDLPAGSIDVIVSNYALHHLPHAEKRELLARARNWLRPGGRIVIADMMFGRGGSAHDRKVLASKVNTLIRKGPGGVWRVVKNLVRFGFGLGTERPAPPQFWIRALRDAGFRDPSYAPIIAEAGMVCATVSPLPTAVTRRRTRPTRRTAAATASGTSQHATGG